MGEETPPGAKSQRTVHGACGVRLLTFCGVVYNSPALDWFLANRKHPNEKQGKI